jgi:rare lipoprotein A
MKNRLWPAVIALLPLLVACAAGPRPRSAPTPPADRGEIFETGVASWYGADFHGKPTANGETYDMHKLTAAHQTLPFHALVEVENLANGKTVLVRINDRGPFLKDRVIDLSLLAAQRLDIVHSGTAPVNLRVRRWPAASDTAGAGAAASDGGECSVQFGAFAFRENADELRMTIAEAFPELTVEVIVEDGMHKVVAERIGGAERCRDIIARLARLRLPGFIRER